MDFFQKNFTPLAYRVNSLITQILLRRGLPQVSTEVLGHIQSVLPANIDLKKCHGTWKYQTMSRSPTTECYLQNS